MAFQEFENNYEILENPFSWIDQVFSTDSFPESHRNFPVVVDNWGRGGGNFLLGKRVERSFIASTNRDLSKP